MPAVAPLLELRGVRKHFGGIAALDGVDFDLHPGEIHALLGENGAGKSTLIKVLGGIHAPDHGEIRVQGGCVTIADVADADRFGIRLIHQELSLAPNLSVAENIFLGREPTRFGLLDRRRIFEQAEALRDELGLPEIGDVRAKVGTLSVAQQQLVEIARALSVRARVLILDEPTASLSAGETVALFAKLRALRDAGVGIIYISHRLEELARLADRITVLRDGRSVGTQDAARLDLRELIRWMVGRELKEHYQRAPHRPAEVALAVRDLRGPGVHGVSFELHHGEILGLAGLVGAGRTELARLLFGIERITGGEVLVEGRPFRPRSPAEALAAGVALVPEDRKRQGLVMTNSVGFNLALPWTREWLCGPIVNRSRRSEIIASAVTGFAIKCSGSAQPVTALSGGNQQKIVVAKWMEHPPKVLILDEPTRGVDVGARDEMFALLHRLIDRGMAILLISSDLPEVMGLSHRLALYREGRLVREAASAEITAEEVMAVLTASKEAQQEAAPSPV
jgi:ABC-type sugar transport system ATPase subunit